MKQSGRKGRGGARPRAPQEGRLGELLARHLSDGVILFDAEERCLMVNPKAEAHLGIAEEEARGQGAMALLELCCRRRRIENEAEWRQIVALNAAEPFRETASYLKIQSPKALVLKRLSLPFLSPEGQRLGRLVILHDVTAFEASTGSSEGLMSLVSHELRTPLTSLKGALNLLMEGRRLGEGEGELVRIANRNCERLERMVDNLLDITRHRSGRLGLTRGVFDLREAAEAAVRLLSATASEKGVEVVLDVPAGAFLVCGDRERLEQVFFHLSDNAIRYTPRGDSVTIGAARAGREVARARTPPDEEGNAPGRVRVSVTDRGTGISPEHMGRIFEPFYQVDAGLTRRSGGLGLGLALARALVEEHGGRIWCESKPGGGSSFFFELPVEFPAEGPNEQDRRLRDAAEARYPVLVVDDDPDVVEIISAMLKKRGYHALRAYSGREALSLTDRLVPWAIILDVRMPGMDGFEVMERLKEDPVKGSVPVILVSAMGEEGRYRAGCLGAFSCLTKPFDEARLMAELERLRGEVADERG